MVSMRTSNPEHAVSSARPSSSFFGTCGLAADLVRNVLGDTDVREHQIPGQASRLALGRLAQTFNPPLALTCPGACIPSGVSLASSREWTPLAEHQWTRGRRLFTWPWLEEEMGVLEGKSPGYATGSRPEPEPLCHRSRSKIQKSYSNNHRYGPLISRCPHNPAVFSCPTLPSGGAPRLHSLEAGVGQRGCGSRCLGKAFQIRPGHAVGSYPEHHILPGSGLPGMPCLLAYRRIARRAQKRGWRPVLKNHLIRACNNLPSIPGRWKPSAYATARRQPPSESLDLTLPARLVPEAPSQQLGYCQRSRKLLCILKFQRFALNFFIYPLTKLSSCVRISKVRLNFSSG